jgi:hypothetical integral membrane protein (TIGR02206 family)
MESKFFLPNNDFTLLGAQHIGVIALFILLGYLLIRWAKNKSPETQYKTGVVIASIISISVVSYTIIKFIDGTFNIQRDLPLQLCNFLGLTIPIFAIYRKYWMYEILVFWILAGTAQGVFTPDLDEGFPHYRFLKYWLEHAGLVLYIIYASAVYGMRPKFKSIFKAFGAIQIYLVLIVGVNALIGSNYLFLMRKPEHTSLLDVLGDWPYYILVEELLIFPFFMLIFGAFKASDYLSKRYNSGQADKVAESA